MVLSSSAQQLTWAQISKNLPAELNTPYIRSLWEKAIKEGGVIFSYGMPDIWANYGGIYSEFKRLFGIEHSDIDMGSSIVLARMTEENASKNDVADLKPSLAQELARRGLTSNYKPRLWPLIPKNQRGQAENGSVWQAGYRGTLGFLVNINIVKKIPRKWKDLLDPQYKGLLEYLDPRATGTGVNTVEAIAYALSGNPYNYQVGVDFLKKLHDMGIVLSVEPKVEVAKFQRGETEDEYYIELMQYGMLQNPQNYNLHFIPGDTSSRYFKKVKLPQNIKLQFSSPTLNINGKNYLAVVFKAGRNVDELRGQAKIVNSLNNRILSSDVNISNNGLIIIGKNTSINLSYSVKIMLTGKISMLY